MRKIIKYDVVKEVYLTNLIAGVNEKIVDGWEPFGNLTAHKDNEFNEQYYLQVVVQYENKQMLND